jgi:hypothetical protein
MLDMTKRGTTDAGTSGSSPPESESESQSQSPELGAPEPGAPDHPARRLWISLETLHDVTYFAPESRAAGVRLGLRGFWMTYFAFRAAPLGPVGPRVTSAAFAGFQLEMVAKALPEAWTRVSPQECTDTRSQVAAGVLTQAGVDPRACAQAVRLLTPIVATADATGRPLFAANAGLQLSDEPVEALWQVATSLREHRGDGHIAALVTAGISGLEAHLLQAAAGRFASEEIAGVRGWSQAEWSRARGRLQARGLLTPDQPRRTATAAAQHPAENAANAAENSAGAAAEDASGAGQFSGSGAGSSVEPGLTDAGGSLLAGIEAGTDAATWTGALAGLGETGVDEIIALLAGSVRAVRAAGILPAFNPTGLPS